MISESIVNQKPRVANLESHQYRRRIQGIWQATRLGHSNKIEQVTKQKLDFEQSNIVLFPQHPSQTISNNHYFQQLEATNAGIDFWVNRTHAQLTLFSIEVFQCAGDFTCFHNALKTLIELVSCINNATYNLQLAYSDDVDRLQKLRLDRQKRDLSDRMIQLFAALQQLDVILARDKRQDIQESEEFVDSLEQRLTNLYQTFYAPVEQNY